MARSISILDYKLNQADFYLSQLKAAKSDFFAAQCYSDSFASSTRSVTFAIQVVLKGVDGFEEWYSAERAWMKADPTAKFFKDYRDVSIHVGETPVLSGSFHDGQWTYYFQQIDGLQSLPDEDVCSACDQFFKRIVDLVYRLYREFRFIIDDRWYFTESNFESRGLGVEDGELEAGLPRGWTKVTGSIKELADRWRLIRRSASAGPAVQDVFYRHLGRCLEGPDDILK